MLLRENLFSGNAFIYSFQSPQSFISSSLLYTLATGTEMLTALEILTFDGNKKEMAVTNKNNTTALMIISFRIFILFLVHTILELRTLFYSTLNSNGILAWIEPISCLIRRME